MTFLDFGATLTGAGADAVWSFIAPSSGFYTIAVGGRDSIGCPACGSATGPFAYAITVTGNAPEPMTLALVGIGIAGLGLTSRKGRTAAVRRLDGVSGSRRRQVICFSLEEQAAPSNRSFYVEEYYARTPIAL